MLVVLPWSNLLRIVQCMRLIVSTGKLCIKRAAHAALLP